MTNPESRMRSEPIRIERRLGAAHLILSGRVTIQVVRQLHARAVEARECGGAVHVHGEHVAYLDAAAAQVLLALRADVEAAGREFRCSDWSPPVREILRISGIEFRERVA